ncbi:MAG: tetratricopeptide repeat protein [Verrucomicrobiota bacterium]
MGISDLQARASDFTERNDFRAARPFLEEIAKRYEDGSEEERSQLGPVFFFIGLGYLQDYSEAQENSNLEQAIAAFSEAIESGVEEGRLIDTLEFRGDAYRGLGQLEDAAADYERLVTDPLDRRHREAKRLEILQKLSLTLLSLEDWERGKPVFRRFLDQSVSEEQRALAASYLLEAFIQDNDMDGILELLPLITVDNPSRYSVSLNVALMQAGDQLADKGLFAQAALLYNATLNRDQIIRYFENLEREQAAMVERMRALGRSEERMADALFELEDVRVQLEAVRQVEPYTSQLMARVARNYYLAGRDYEAVWAYLRFVDRFPDDPIAQEFQFAAFITATKLGLEELSRDLGEQMLGGRIANQEFRKRVLLALASAYLDSNDEDSFYETVDSYLEEFPDSVEAGQVVFLLGNYLLNKGDIEELQGRLSLIAPAVEGKSAEDGIHYWQGLGFLFDSQLEEAMNRFDLVVSDQFPDSVYREDAFYRRAIALYGQDKTDEAEKLFEEFALTFPNSGLRGEAEFFLGEIDAARADILKAIAHYEQVDLHTDNIGFITSAYFQKAKILERNNVLKRAAETYQEYIDKHGEDGQLTQAIFLLGEIRKKQGRPGDALTQYQNAILRFGNDPANLGVDPMITTYVNEYDETLRRLESSLAFLEKLETDEEFRKEIATNRGALYQQFVDDPDLDQSLYEELRQSAEFSKSLEASTEPLQPYLESYRAQLDDFPKDTPTAVFEREFNQAKQTNKRTLAMRMQMALEDLGSPPRSPLVIQESDLELASPAILVWIGEGKERTDPVLSKLAYRAAIDYEENVPEKVSAYLNLGDILLSEGSEQEALQLYEQAEENFPADPEIYRSLIAQARILGESGELEAAREKLLSILKTPDWRGEPHAEALYRVGVTYFEEGLFPEAHGFFERTFLGYGLFDEWAVRAYLMDAKTLVEMGQIEDARRTLNEALENESYQNIEGFNELVEYANSI